MSVALKIVDKRFACDGATTVFALANLIYLANADLKVWLVDALGNPTLWTLGVEYVLTGSGSTGAGILTAAGAGAFDNTHAIYVLRATDDIQNQVFVEGGGFPAKNAENAYDRRTLRSQEIAKGLSLAITAPPTDPALDLTLQPAPQRAGFVTVFDGAGRLVASTVSAAALAIVGVGADMINTLTQLASALSGDYLFAQPTDAYLNTPTGAEPLWYRALVGKAPTGVFAGYRGRIAIKSATGWIFSPAPRAGQRVYDTASQLWWASQNGWWNRLKSNKAGAIYQYMGDIPDGTQLSGLLAATGQQIVVQGSGQASLINNGRYEPVGNSYITVAFPYNELRMSMMCMFRTPTSQGGVTLAAGTLDAGGAIISGRMNHTEFLFQDNPNLSIWHGPRQTSDGMGGFLGYLATGEVQSIYRAPADLNYPQHALGQMITNEVTIQGNVLRGYADGRRIAVSYRDDMISGSCGDDPVHGWKGYLYFQTGGVDPAALLPYVYEISADATGPVEQLADPFLVPNSSLLPIVRAADCPFTVATEVTRFTPSDGNQYAFQVDAQAITPGSIGAIAEAVRSWVFLAKEYVAGITVSSPTGLFTEQTLSTNPAVISLSCALTVVIVGTDVLLKATVTRTGTDATAYTPHVQISIRTVGAAATFN